MLKKLTSKNRQEGKKNSERGKRERKGNRGRERGKRECERERGRRRELSAFKCKMFFSIFNWKQTHSDYFHTNIQES